MLKKKLIKNKKTLHKFKKLLTILKKYDKISTSSEKLGNINYPLHCDGERVISTLKGE